MVEMLANDTEHKMLWSYLFPRLMGFGVVLHEVPLHPRTPVSPIRKQSLPVASSRIQETWWLAKNT